LNGGTSLFTWKAPTRAKQAPVLRAATRGANPVIHLIEHPVLDHRADLSVFKKQACLTAVAVYPVHDQLFQLLK